MQTIEIIGSVAAVLTTLSFIPQAWQTFKTKDVSGISLPMYSMFTTGVLLWLVYSVALQSWPMIVSNCITAPVALAILSMKLRYRKAAAPADIPADLPAG
jgi:MtN3 and saliva related transmembrane protein